MNSAARCLMLLALFCCASVNADESQYSLTPGADQLSQLSGELPAPSETVSTVTPQRFSQKYPLRTVGSSLAIVLGGFWLLTLLFRKANTGSKPVHTAEASPNHIMQSLDTLKLNDRTQLQMVRVGGRILVLAVGDANVQTLTEFKDAVELEQLLSPKQRHGDATGTTRQSLDSFVNHPPVGDLLQRVESRLRESA